jgi:phage terminase small subunit
VQRTPQTVKQTGFIEAILRGLSGVKAAKAAGYKGNDTTLAAVAYENLRKPHIKAAILKRKAEIEVTTELTVEYIQREHERLARLAEEKLDLATATRNKELAGKTIAAYIDKKVTLNMDAGRRPPDRKAVESSEAKRKAIDNDVI